MVASGMANGTINLPLLQPYGHHGKALSIPPKILEISGEESNGI